MKQPGIQAGALIALALTAMTGTAAEVKRMEFGRLADGRSIEAVDLIGPAGVSAKIITLGATVQSLNVPDRNGKSADIVLGYSSAQEYLAKPQYFGVTVGRYANRIRAGQFELDGKRYKLATNDGPNHLHG